jgi:electron transport complex protein RnfB
VKLFFRGPLFTTLDPAQVMEQRCIGCGLCVPACPAEAISMKERKDKEAPPETFADTLSRIATERGVQ